MVGIARIVRNTYRGGMPTGTRDEPSEFTEALMTVIRAKMGMLQMNIADLSRKTEIPRSTLSRIVNSKRQADIDQIRVIAIALNMPMAQLMSSADDILAGKDPFQTG
jgi:transcriptional regulator with XRE-family HTH domain